MKKIISGFIGIFLLISTLACTKQPNLAGLDLETWKSDRGGCQGKRLAMLEKVKSLKEEIRGVSANDMDDYLGKPDIQQLADRNQKYYIYFFEPGTHCQNKTQKSSALSMSIRFSAMGIATEVAFQHGTP